MRFILDKNGNIWERRKQLTNYVKIPVTAEGAEFMPESKIDLVISSDNILFLVQSKMRITDKNNNTYQVIENLRNDMKLKCLYGKEVNYDDVKTIMKGEKWISVT